MLTLRYSGPKKGFTFSTYVECHKDAYQNMLTLAKKTDYVVYNPSTCVRHFLNGITDPSLTQVKLSLEANHEQYSGNFDACVEYLMNQVTHQQVNQQINIVSVGSGAPNCLKTKDKCHNNIVMPLVEYTNEQWAQLSSGQKTSIQKCCQAQHDKENPSHCNGSRKHKRPRGECAAGQGHGQGRGLHSKSAVSALVASVATLSDSVHVMATRMDPSSTSNNDEDAKPAANNKMKSNVHNSALTRSDARLCLMGTSYLGVTFVLLSMLSH